MPPLLHENDIKPKSVEIPAKPQYRLQIVWFNVLFLVIMHILAANGFYRCFTTTKILTILYSFSLSVVAGMSITAGAHRLWAHRTYTANLPLRLLFVTFNTMAFQNSIYVWSRDHRLHHKYSETNADPHNALRGFFFAHCGWLMCKKHPDVSEKGKTIDMSDLMNDPLLKFQNDYYAILMPLCCFFLPGLVPVYFWGETVVNSYLCSVFLRWVVFSHSTWLVNSAAHLYGTHPYDKFINPAENSVVAMATFGEGWHNYHHTFPWDYKAAELGNNRTNATRAMIDFFARIGWATNLKYVETDVLYKRIKRTGDGSHEIWGWNDDDMTLEDRQCATIDYAEMPY